MSRLIAVAGSVTVDILGYGARLPRPGESVLGRRLLIAPGGKGANQAVAAARLGATVRLSGARGDDAHGELCAAALARDGVDLSAVAVHPGAETGVALICVDDAGDNQILALPGANALAAPPPPCGAALWLCRGRDLPGGRGRGARGGPGGLRAGRRADPSPVHAIPTRPSSVRASTWRSSTSSSTTPCAGTSPPGWC